ncbi:MAG TPA: hypothetical protein VHX38_08850 [Pseudonocardiaceae bacterium]|jgi:hypothetical protein|nr:hypothetical protein [Pseudonocardiaceae bacterium]
MDNERRRPSPESETTRESNTPERFGYFLNTDPAAVVDMWKKYSGHVGAHAPYAFLDDDATIARSNELDKEAGIDISDAEDVGEILGQEFPEFAKAHPRRAAELVAEILRREDPEGDFILYTNAPTAILYIASRDHELGVQMWAMFRELASGENASEAAIHMHEEIEPRDRDGEGAIARRHAERLQGADRVAMILFYLEHVKQYE